MTPSKRKRRRSGAPSRDGRARSRRRKARGARGATEGPRYQQVANELIDSIGGGIYPIGALLPTEMELCEQYQISRSTVREALKSLEVQGLVQNSVECG